MGYLTECNSAPQSVLGEFIPILHLRNWGSKRFWFHLSRWQIWTVTAWSWEQKGSLPYPAGLPVQIDLKWSPRGLSVPQGKVTVHREVWGPHQCQVGGTCPQHRNERADIWKTQGSLSWWICGWLILNLLRPAPLSVKWGQFQRHYAEAEAGGLWI